MTKKQEKQILSLRKKGASIKSIARETGVGEHSVAKFIKANAADKPKGPILGKYVKIADPKSVDGTDEVRISLPKCKDVKNGKGDRCKCKCKLAAAERAKDEADSIKDDEVDTYKCSVSISAEYPADVLDDNETQIVKEAMSVATEFVRGIVCAALAEHGYEKLGNHTSNWND